MPSKKHKPEEIIGKLREAEIVLAQGGSAAEASRRIAVSEQTGVVRANAPRVKKVGLEAALMPRPGAVRPMRTNLRFAHSGLCSLSLRP